MWTKEQSKFVGRIIYANLLELPLDRYKNVIRQAQRSIRYRKSCGSTIITGRLSNANSSRKKTKKVSKLIAEIVHPVRSKASNGVKNNNGFCIRYTYDGFNKIHTYYGNPGSRLFYKLRQISSRNKLAYRIIKEIIKHQKNFLNTCNPDDLVPFSQVQLVKQLNRGHSSKVDISWVSRLVNGLSVIIPSGEERTLKSFLANQRDVNKKLIKQLIDLESEDIESGKLKKLLTDRQIRLGLRRVYGVNISRSSICLCRKEMGIASVYRRFSGDKYSPFSVNFSGLFALTVDLVQNNVPASSGVYELRLKDKEIDYPKGKTKIFYLGSTKDLKKRLKEHLRTNNKNAAIRQFLKKHGCSFRYIQYSKNWRGEEGGLYNLFVSTYGASPKCNRVKPESCL